MASDFIVIDGVKYVLDRDGRTLRTKVEIQTLIARVNQVKSDFNTPQDAELVRLGVLLDKFPG